MKASNRVRLIQQLAQALQEEEWTDIDLLLRQFEFPWTDNWQGTKHAYLVEMLQDGDDDNLLQLHEHVFGIGGADSVEEPDCWTPGLFRLFLSHVSEEKELAADLKAELLRYGVDCFVAHEDIKPTRAWVEEIEIALGSCHALLAILTEGFRESDWTDQEVGFCHGRRVLIISVQKGEVPYGFMSRYQAVNMSGKETSDVARELYEILVRHEKTAARMAEGMMTAFETSGTFADAKHVAFLLQDIVSWTPELLRRLEAAGPNNSQIRDAWGVPGQVQRLLREHGAAAGPAGEDDLPF